MFLVWLVHKNICIGQCRNPPFQQNADILKHILQVSALVQRLANLLAEFFLLLVWIPPIRTMMTKENSRSF